MSISKEKGTCSFCGKERLCVKSASGVLICTSCLSEARQMVKDTPTILSGVIHCPKCKGKSFAVTELVMYEQDRRGNFSPANVVLDEDPQVRCLGCGSLMTGSIQCTILNRVVGPVSEVKDQRI